MKCLIILVILPLTDSCFRSGGCLCDKSTTTCSAVHKCDNSELADYDCIEFHYQSEIATEDACIHLLRNSTSYHGVEWRSGANRPCRSIQCMDVNIQPYNSGITTVYWKTCDADCGCLQNPANGFVIKSAGIEVGSKANYFCEVGYTLSGPSTLICNAYGNWSEPPPTCILIDCGAPIAPANGYVNFTLTTYGRQANYNCNEGFYLDGSTNTTCGANGTWSDSPVVCLIKNCQNPTAPLNGSVNYTSTTFKSQANYSCDEGFNLLGSTNTTCRANGNWSDSPVVCLIKDCDAPTPPLHGSVNYASTTFKSQANYSCDEGFYLDGSTNTTCGANGNWSGSPVVCLIKDCDAPTAPLNGSVNYTSTTFKSQANYSCDVGFDLLGSTNTTCGANGNWSDSQVTCVIKDCDAPTPPLNGSANYSSTTFKSQANYSCDEGFDLLGSTNTTCRANGNWSDSPVVCLIKDCDAPTPPLNGSVNYSSTTFKSQANYSCDEGFYLDGSTSTTCGANGNWSGSPVVCLIKNCDAPTAPLNGSVNYTSTTFKSQANYSCDEGFDLLGSTNTTCRANGNWSDSPVVCLIKDCNAPTPPLNGSVNYSSTTFKSQANYSCDEGFYLDGSTSTTCGANGNWSGSPVVCLIKNCDAPTAPLNGSVNYTSTTFKSQAYYSCEQGFNLVGITYTTCGDNGNWTNDPPNCTLIDCKVPSQVINGQVDFNETTYGKQSVYSCDPGFNIAGPKTLMCQVNGRWGPFKPSCLAPGTKRRLYIVPCTCNLNKTFDNMTQDEILAHLVNETRIDTKNTSASLDKLRSRPDSRTSSAVIGTVAIVILSTLGGIIVCSDLITICKNRHARHTSK